MFKYQEQIKNINNSNHNTVPFRNRPPMPKRLTSTHQNPTAGAQKAENVNAGQLQNRDLKIRLQNKKPYLLDTI